MTLEILVFQAHPVSNVNFMDPQDVQEFLGRQESQATMDRKEFREKGVYLVMDRKVHKGSQALLVCKAQVDHQDTLVLLEILE